MFHPPTHTRARTEYNISTRTLIALSCFGQINLLDSVKPKQASINAFYVIAFLRCRSQRLQFNVAERGRLFIVHFVLQVAIYIARRLEVQACFRIVEFLEQARVIHLIERFLHRQAAFLHKTGDEVFYYLLLHILKFCLRNVHCLISLSIALCVQKAY